MKKRLFLLSLLIIFVFGFGWTGGIDDFIYECIEKKLDDERAEEVGDDFNKVFWENGEIQINHHKTGNNLEIINGDNVIPLLENILRYKIKGKILYVISDKGVAVINSNNYVKLYVKDMKEIKDNIIKSYKKIDIIEIDYHLSKFYRNLTKKTTQ